MTHVKPRSRSAIPGRHTRTKPMANNKEEAGKGTPRPGETPGSKRTYATIDLTASEVEGKDRPPRPPASAASAASAAAAEAKSQAKPEAKPADARSRRAPVPAVPARRRAARPPARPASIGARALAAPWLSHLAAGALGAIVVLIVGRADDDGPAAGAVAGGRRPDAAPDGSGRRARHASGRRLARPGRGDGALDRRARRDAGQARPRDQGARRQGRHHARVSARADGPARQAGGGAGGGDGRRSGRPVAAGGGAVGQACRAGEGRAQCHRAGAVRHRPLRRRAVDAAGPTPAVSPSGSTR